MSSFLSQVRKWAEDKLPKYGLPSLLKVLENIPRSLSGTINKKELVDVAFPPTENLSAPDQFSRMS